MFMRPSGMRSSTSAISHAQPTGAQPVVGRPTRSRTRAPRSRHSRDHRPVALLEDVQRDELGGAARRCRAGTAGSRGPAPSAISSLRPPLAPYLGAMTSTAIVWFRRDLRVHDHPALAAAHREHDRVVPVFVLDHALLGGPLPSRPTDRVPARLPRASCAARCASAAAASWSGTAGPRRSCPRWRARCGATARLLAERRLAVRAGPRSPGDRRAARRRRGARRSRAAIRRRRRPAAHAGRRAVPSSRPSTGRGRQLERREVHRAPRALPPSVRLAPRPPPGSRRPAGGGRARSRAGRARGARARDALARRRPSTTTRSATTSSPAARRGSRPTCTSAACPRASSRSARATAARRQAFVRQLALARLLRARAPPPSRQRATSPGALPRASSGTPTRELLDGLAGGPHRLPARRRRRCASCAAPAGCTTAAGSSSARS